MSKEKKEFIHDPDGTLQVARGGMCDKEARKRRNEQMQGRSKAEQERIQSFLSSIKDSKIRTPPGLRPFLIIGNKRRSRKRILMIS